MAHAWRAEALVCLGPSAAALAAADNAITLDPDMPAAHLHRGWALGRLKRPEEARAAFDRAIELDPEYWRAFTFRGGLLGNQLRLYEEALADYRRAATLGGAHPGIWQSQCFLLSRLGRFEEARRAGEHALRLAPRYARALNALADLLATCPEPRHRNLEKAVRLAKRAVELAPKDGMIRNTLGVAYCRSGEWMAGRTALEMATKLDGGDDGTTRFFLALAHGHLGEKETAREWFDKAEAWMKEHDPESEDLKRLRAEAADLLGIED